MMNKKIIARYIALILLIEAVFMVPALLISLFDRSFGGAIAFVISIAIVLAVAGVLHLLSRSASPAFNSREGLITAAFSWIMLSLLGCLPFYISREIPSFIDAFFETVSGFTTTGASILPNVELMSRGMLYWRSFSHWVGGMGVLVFLLALAPTGRHNGGFTMHLLRAESPGPDVGKLVPHIRDTASILYIIYICLTVLDYIFLRLGAMPRFDAICTALGTAGTGGFGVKADSIAGYSPYLQNVCTVFMFLFGINFSCYYLLLLRRFSDVAHDEELRLYVTLVLVSTGLIVFNTRSLYGTWEETIRHAFFQVSSIITTTGFATTDFDLWPSFSKCILLFLMIVGACAGSTGGGLKCSRALLIYRSTQRNIRQAIHPARIRVVHMNRAAVSEDVLRGVGAYLGAYVFLLVISVVLISVDNLSVTTNISAVLACFNNIGPGLDAVGPACNYALFSPFSKLVLIVDMLAGRLELFPILVLFSSATWKNK